MIYQLMKRDPAWRYLPYLVVACAVAGSLFGTYPVYASPICCMAPFVGAFWCTPNRRATRYEASLPVAGRQLFLARELLMTAAIWLPAATSYCAALIAGGPAKLGPEVVGCAAIITLLVMAIQSVRARELAAPGWTLLVFLVVASAAVGAFLSLPNTAAPVLAGSALLAGALLSRTWRAIPKTFELAPAATWAGRTAAKSAGEPITVWMPLLRSAWAAQLHGATPVFCLLAAMQGQWIGACVIFPIVLWRLASRQVRWAMALPVKGRVLLWAIFAPILIALPAGYLLSFHHGGRHPRPFPEARIQVFTLAAMFAVALLTLLFSAGLDSRRLRHTPLGVRRAVYRFVLVVPSVPT